MTTKRLAAFIITFERAAILCDTIRELFQQSLPPEKILIVDNSITDDTEIALRDFDPRVEYYKVGYNSGPAGGARFGLDILAKQGYKWIFWGDDDNPPPIYDCLEKLVHLGESYNGKCGQVGLVGHKFNRLTGKFNRTKNEELFKGDFVEVDSIGGGMCKLINAEIVLDGVLPEEKLFFGFEDLDFDIATKKAGYQIIAHSKLFLYCRQQANRMDYKHVINRKKDESRIWRDYYSIRNTLYIMKKNKYYLALFCNFSVAVLKSLMSYKHGIRYGNLTTRNTLKAIQDYSAGKYYKRELN